MKKILCILFALTICLCLFGCQSAKETEEITETIPMETRIFNQNQRFSGKIVDKISPNILVVGSLPVIDVFEGEEVVHVITDQYDSWDVGASVEVVFLELQRPHDTAQPVRVIAKKIDPPTLYGKPIIYLYPEEPTECSVTVDFDGELTYTYPEHGENGWQNFTAYPDGTLISPDGKEYYALFWEGVKNTEWDFSKGFCVRGEDTAEFLEWALDAQGLSRREANEFIIYWLPLMQDNPYNVISFQTDTYTDNAGLDITPAPDSLIRVFMTYYASDVAVDIEPQAFDKPERFGFSVVEWGGSCVG